MKFGLMVGLVATVLSFNAYAVSNNKEYMDFFNKYDALNKAYNPEVFDLYANNAKFFMSQMLPDGTETKIAMPVSKLKTLKIDAMNYAKQVGDIDQYSNIKVENENGQVKITADRYSLRKCVTDHSFYLIVNKKNSAGEIQIIEAGAEIPVESQCKEGMKSDLDLQLAIAAKYANMNLPMKIDGDILVEKVTVQDKTIIYHYKMINFSVLEIDKELFKENVEANILSNACQDVNMKKLFEEGAAIAYQYSSKEDLPITLVKIDSKACNSI